MKNKTYHTVEGKGSWCLTPRHRQT